MSETALLEARPPLDLTVTEPQVKEIYLDLEPGIIRALETVQAVTGCIGQEIEASTVREASEISTEPGIYIINPDKDVAPLRQAQFSFLPEGLSGAADSAHSVLTGEMTLDFEGRPEPKEMRVAIKCFNKRTLQDRTARALREIEFMELMERRGEPTLTPIALAIAPDDGRTHGEVVLVTEYDPTIQTLDNRPWGRGLTEANCQTALKAIHALSHFNADLGILHGDAKIKNVAVDDVSNKVGMIDFETSREINVNEPTEAAEAALKDLSLLLVSLYKKGFLKHGQKDSDDFANHLMEQYLGAWDEHPTPVQEAVTEAAVSALINCGIDS